MKKVLINRRQSVGTAAATTAAITVLPRHILGGPKFVAPSDTVNIALIGCGGQGRTNARNLFTHKDARIIAVADPNEVEDYSRFYYKGLAGRKPVKAEVEKRYQQDNSNFKCGEYIDFRKLFDKEKSVDAILCATPDHWHAFVTMAAVKLGKHVYCEKPLTHNIYEARMVARAAEEAGVATQMGNQGHSDEGNRLMCEWIWDGAIGDVKEVHAWSSAGGWSSGRGKSKNNPAVPKTLDWDMWLGPHKDRPYSPDYAPYNWRGWWEFGTGCVGDMSVHNFDPAFTALQPGHPVSIEGTSDFVDSEVIGPNNKVVWEFAGKDGKPGVKFFWYDGNQMPQRPEELEPGRRMGGGGNGVLVIGTKGKIMGDGWSRSPRIIPETKMRAYSRPEKTLSRSRGHHRDWLDACKGGKPASSNFSAGAKLTEFVLLGDVAIRSRKKIYWDGPNMQVKNAPEAAIFVKEEYRTGWDLEKM